MNYYINTCKYNIRDFIKEIITNEFNIDYWNEWLDKQDYEVLKVTPNILVSCEENDKLIGICAIKFIDNKAYLNSFYVLKEYRNKGIGTELYNRCENYAKDNNYERIDIKVDPHFKDAIKFYEQRRYIFDKYDDEQKELYYHKDID